MTLADDDWVVSIGELEAAAALDASRTDGTLDDDDAIALIERRIGPEAADRARARARELVSRAYASGQLERVADALLAEGSLTGEHLDRLLNDDTKGEHQ